MDLADILGREQIVPELKATNRWEAIDELIGNLVATGKIKAENRDAIDCRRQKARNLHEHGHRFRHRHPPRLHGSDLLKSSARFGRSKARASISTPSTTSPSTSSCLFLVPQGQFQKHLHTLANIAKLFHKAEFRQALEEASDADAMYRIKDSSGNTGKSAIRARL
jgi:mannitol/fructose-specific phosphotransferase system IIA component (Ntr-type)